jgi:hypothetical protein
LFNVLIVDANLSERAPAQIFDLALRGTNVVVADVLNVLEKMNLSAQNLTLQSNAAINIYPPNLFWSDSVSWLKTFTNSGSITASNALYFVSQNADGSERPYGTIVNQGEVRSIGNYFRSGDFIHAGLIQSLFGPIQIEATTNVTLSSGSTLEALQNEVSIAGKNIAATNAIILPGRSLSFSVTGSLMTGPNDWTVRDGFNLLSKPMVGDFTFTSVSNVALAYARPYNWWAGEDRGASLTGFTNNGALGRLILDGGPNSLFSFVGMGPSDNALYVDVLVLLNSATNTDASGNLVALDVQPGMKLYYSKAFAGTTDITDTLAGKNGGALSKLSHDGYFTGPPEGLGGRPAAADLNLQVAIETASPAVVRVSWNAQAGSAYTLYSIGPSNVSWTAVTNVVSTVTGRISVTEPLSTGGGRFYKIGVR